METLWQTKLSCKNSKKYNCLKVTVYYELGDYSLFTHEKNPRGYYVSVRPTLVEEKDGYVTETFQIFGGGGYKHLLFECSRKSKKNAEKAIEQGKAFYPRMVDYICVEQGLELIKEV